VIAIEPIPSTYNALQRNIAVNGYGDRVQALNIGLGRRNDTLRFSADCDTVNHVLADGEKATSVVRVPVKRLDDVLQGGVPVIIKIDVEGFETEVLAGAERTLANSGLLAVIMELNGSGERYGFDEDALHRNMLAFGFSACRYAPFTRELEVLDGRPTGGNTLYVRDVEELEKRVKNHMLVRLGTKIDL